MDYVCFPPIKGLLWNKKHISVLKNPPCTSAFVRGYLRICSSLHIKTCHVLQAIQLLSLRNKAWPKTQSSQLFITCVAVLHSSQKSPCFRFLLCLSKYWCIFALEIYLLSCLLNAVALMHLGSFPSIAHLINSNDYCRKFVTADYTSRLEQVLE